MFCIEFAPRQKPSSYNPQSQLHTNKKRGDAPSITGETTMTITASQLKEIRKEFAALEPATVTLNGNRAMTVKYGHFHSCPGTGTDEEARF